MGIRSIAVAVATCLPFALVGCSSTRSSSAPPAVDPQAAAVKAIQTLDNNGDARLSEKELAACPSMFASREYYDSDKDLHLSQAEIEARLKTLYSLGVAFVDVRCEVTAAGRPLPGATVRFVPESFLAEWLQPASGTTNQQGMANLSVPADQLPENLNQMQMMQVGLYRVEIEHPSASAKSTKRFGFEVDPARRGGTTASFDVQAK